MRKLIVLVALACSTSAAWAQVPGATPVTKLPGEENLSVRERAERDFLMPVRRKKAEAARQQPAASVEQLASAAPETDAVAHYSEAAPDPRPTVEEAVTATHEATRAERHAAWLSARRAARRRAAYLEDLAAERRAEARRAARHHGTSSSKHSSAKAKTKTKASHAKTKTKAKATKATRASKAAKTKASSHKAKAHTSTSKAKAHLTSSKSKIKKPATHKKRR